MKILFVSNTFPIPPGNGIELTLARYMEYFSINNEVFFALISETQVATDACDRIEAAPKWIKKVFQVNAVRPGPIKRVLEEVTLHRPFFYSWDYHPHQLRNIFSQSHFDVIWASPVGIGSFCDAYRQYVSSSPAMILGMNDSIYYFYFERGMAFFKGREKLRHLIRSPFLLAHEHKYLNRFDAVHVQTKQERRRIERIFSKHTCPNIIVAQTGINEDLLTIPYTADSKIILFLAHLASGAQKQSIWFLKKVWPEIRDKHKSVVLKVVGKPAAPELANLLSGITGIQQHGFAADYGDAFKNAALAVIPIQKSSGIVTRVLDSMTAGVPVIGSTKAMNTLDGFVNGLHGIAADTRKDMRNSINELLNDPVKCAGISINARNYVKNKFSWQEAYSRVDSGIQELLFSSGA